MLGFGVEKFSIKPALIRLDQCKTDQIEDGYCAEYLNNKISLILLLINLVR
jgi:hypothetical protein